MTDGHKSSRLGALLRQHREKAGLSLYELARRSGVSRGKLLHIERGDVRQPTPATLNKLAAALGIEPEDFYDAMWQDSTKPLPSPAIYLRSKYHLSEDQIAQLQATIERAAAEADDT